MCFPLELCRHKGERSANICKWWSLEPLCPTLSIKCPPAAPEMKVMSEKRVLPRRTSCPASWGTSCLLVSVESGSSGTALPPERMCSRIGDFYSNTVADLSVWYPASHTKWCRVTEMAFKKGLEFGSPLLQVCLCKERQSALAWLVCRELWWPCHALGGGRYCDDRYWPAPVNTSDAPLCTIRGKHTHEKH